jgi:tetratricopeptide (TPR) repeat protein
MYKRVEEESIRAFYKLYGDWLPQTPAHVASFVNRVATLTGLPAQADTYPAVESAVRKVAGAAARAAGETLPAELDLDNADPAQLDRLIDGLVPQSAEWGVPREPLLYYSLGAFWGEWQVRHRQARWSLYSPLRPVQSFPDMVTAGPTICSHPFSQVCKKFTDPEGDNLEFKSKAMASHKRFLPPFPLLASLADADRAARDLLPEIAQRGADAEEADNPAQAYELYCEAAYHNDQIPQLLARIIGVAWQLEKWDMVDGVSQRLLALVPDHPTTCHNLAVLYSGNEEYLNEAIDLLQQALTSDPHYARAHMTLASCLAERGDRNGARQHAQWVVENDQELAEEAKEFIREMG